MKNYFKFLGLLVFSLVVLSCSRGSGDSDDGYYFRARVNGVNFVSDEHYREAVIVSGSGFPTRLTIGGIRNGKEKIDIHFNDYTEGVTGDFPFTLPGYDPRLKYITGAYAKDVYNRDESQIYVKAVGILTITHNANGKIRGTFAFKAYNNANQEVTISDGQFHLPLTRH